jgi:hypothetical protein
MTFEELENLLPNGFHDAAIRKISLDFSNRSIVIGMNMLVGGPGEPDPERSRPGTVNVVSPYLFFLEPPDPRYPFILGSSPVNASGGSVKFGESAKVDPLLQHLPKEATALGLFLDDWNSYIYIAAANVEFSWDDGGALE